MNKITKNIKLQNCKTLALCLAIVSTFITSNTSCASGSSPNPHNIGMWTIPENVALPDYKIDFTPTYTKYTTKDEFINETPRSLKYHEVPIRLNRLLSLREVMQRILSFTDWLRCNSNYRLQYRNLCKNYTGLPPSESIWKEEKKDIEFLDGTNFADACSEYDSLFDIWKATQRELQTKSVRDFFNEKDVGEFFADCIGKIDKQIADQKERAQAHRYATKKEFFADCIDYIDNIDNKIITDQGLSEKSQDIELTDIELIIPKIEQISNMITDKVLSEKSQDIDLTDIEALIAKIEQISNISFKAKYECCALKKQLHILSKMQNTLAGPSEENRRQYNLLLKDWTFWETWPVTDKDKQLELCINKKALLVQELIEMNKIRERSEELFRELLKRAKENGKLLKRAKENPPQSPTCTDHRSPLAKILDEQGLRYDSDGPRYIDLNPSDGLDVDDIQLEPSERGMPLLPPIQPPTFDPMQPDLSLPLSSSTPPHDRTGRLRRLLRQLLMSSLNGLVASQAEELLNLVILLGNGLATDYS